MNEGEAKNDTAQAVVQQDQGSIYWSKPKCSGTIPVGRSGHTLTVLGDKAYMFGGCDEDMPPGPSNQLYRLKLSPPDSRTSMEWTLPRVSGEPPMARWLHSSTPLDKKRILMFGGFHSDTNRFNDIHILDTKLMTWTQPLSPMGEFTPRGNHIPTPGASSIVPCPRGGHTANLVGDNIVIFGGYGGMGYGRRDFNDIFRFNISKYEWRKVPPIKGKVPEPRSGHSSSVVQGRLFVYGGWNAQAQFSNLYVLDFQKDQWTWEETELELGASRWCHSAIGVAAIPNWRLFIFGGSTGMMNERNTKSSFTNDTIVLDCGSMTIQKPDIVGEPPLPRADTEMVYDSKNSRILMFGGWANEWYQDICAMDVSNIVGPPYAIMGLEPTSGPITGASRLTIKGIDFVNTSQITIRFTRGKHFEEVIAEYVDEETLVCMTPNFAHMGPGDVIVRASLNGNALTTTFQKYAFFSVADCTQCIMYGPGLISGLASELPNELFIQSRDAGGNNRVSGGDEFTVTVAFNGGREYEPEVEYISNGLYRVPFEVMDAGEYVVSVIFEGTYEGEPGHIAGSPVNVEYTTKSNEMQNKIDGNFVIDAIESGIGKLLGFGQKTLAALRNKVPDDDVDALLSVMERLHAVSQKKDIMKTKIDRSRTFLQHLIREDLGGSRPGMMIATVNDCITKLDLCIKQIPNTKAQIAPLIKRHGSRTKIEIANFTNDIEVYLAEFKRLQFWAFSAGPSQANQLLDEAQTTQATKEVKYENMLHIATMFEFPEAMEKSKSLLRTVSDMLTWARGLWHVAEECMKYFEDQNEALWISINANIMEEKAKDFMKRVKKCNKAIKFSNAYKQTEKMVKDFLATCPLIVALHHPSMRPRHWELLMKATGKEFTPPYSDPHLKVGGLLALNLHEFSEQVDEITDQSQKEEKMENSLAALETQWSQVEWDFDEYATHDTDKNIVHLLKMKDEEFEQLEADQLVVQSMLGNRYMATFEEEITSWNKALNSIADVVVLLTEIQGTWSYLEPLFIGSDEVKKELPADAKRFVGVDKDLKEILVVSEEAGNIKDACSIEGCYGKLENVNERLSQCKKSLKDFLSGKQRIFPRFYFVSEAQLLDLLSNGSQPHKIMKHTTAVFLATKTFILEPKEIPVDGSRPSAVTWISDVGVERTNFKSPVKLSGKPEKYLQVLLDEMKSTMVTSMELSLKRYPTQPRVNWLLDVGGGNEPKDPAQIALLVTAVYYVKEVFQVFKDIENGDEGALKKYNKKQIDQLGALIEKTRTDLNKRDRRRVMTTITLDAHGRDIVQKLIREGVQKATAFQWMSQLKQSIDEGKAVCDICDARFDYGYEYLGNGGRLVITPLTDRIYVTATQALHLGMGCAPAGPAGTGKTETTKDLAASLGKICYVFNCSPEMDYKSMGNIFKGLAASGSWGCFDEFNRLIAPVLSVCTVQFKAVCDGIRAGNNDVTVEGDTVMLDPTCGAFITMNPGYLGRSELPEGLKALFRPMTVMVPDLVLICENMMMAEGFEDAKALARKFYGLYSLLRELLSKQDHYDWGLRAVKSVLVVAGGFKRAEPDVVEDAILCRALRDFNTPKIVKQDEPVFFGLLSDLFPGINPPRKVDQDLESAVEDACNDRGMTPDPDFMLKVVQLQELLEIRHCVFVMGPPAAGKTECFKTLQSARSKLGDETSISDLNPKAIIPEELYGYVSLATREWKDGVLSKTMRDLGNMPDGKNKWIVLDGDLDANWIESMNSVMDDNKMLTLASNERVPLKGNMRMLFEIRDLKYATPATVSRAGILYISDDDGTQWKSLITSWLSKSSEGHHSGNGFLSPSAAAILQGLFAKYTGQVLKWIKINTKPLVGVRDMNIVESLCTMLKALLTGTMKQFADSSSESALEPAFVFSAIWAFGCTLSEKDGIDYRKLFSDYWKANWKSVKIPSRETVFDYWLNPQTNAFDQWKNSPYFTSINFDPLETPMSQVTVPTPDTASVTHWMVMLVDLQAPLMLVGNAGCGKTQLINGLLGKQDAAKRLSLTVNFNFYTNADLLKRTLEGPLEKKTGTNYAPKGTADMIYFLDDLNLPEVDEYNTQSAISLVRQQMDYGGWYDMQKIQKRHIMKCQYVACMNPTAGCFEINPRLQRHFTAFAIGFPGPTSLLTIYQTFLDGHFKHFPGEMKEISSNLINAALGLHAAISKTFRKTAANFHYEFNVRHLSNVFQGLLTAKPDEFKEPAKFVMLWLHESERVYGDRLVSYDDLKKYKKEAQAQSKKRFAKYNLAKFFADKGDPLIFCHDEERIYDQILSIDKLKNTMELALKEYNEVNAAMNLVLFEDAVKHVARIMRIILNPSGHALLVGVGGSGKQSLSRLASFVCSYNVMQIVLTSTYSINDLKVDIGEMYKKAGVKDEGTTFLFTDSQIANEKFLVFMNDLLSSGNIPDLFPQEDVDDIVNAVTHKVKNSGMVPDHDNCWSFFINEVKKNLHVILCFSPVGEDFRIRAMKFPALVNCTVIDWFQPWPEAALHKVGTQFLQDLDLGSNKNVRAAIEGYFPYSFESVNQATVDFKKSDRRFVYTTPKTYLELLKLYNALLVQKRVESSNAIERLENGLKKLRETAAVVTTLEADLKVKLIAAEEKKVKAEGIAEVVAKEKAVVEKETSAATVEAEKCAIIQEEVTKIAADAQKDLDEAVPLVEKAMAALATLNKKELGECKTMSKPPTGVDDVFSAVMVLVAGVKTEGGNDLTDVQVSKAGKVRDRSWGAAKKALLGNVGGFLDALLSYKDYVDAFVVPKLNWKEVRQYLAKDTFDVDVIYGKNKAAAGLCSWVINIVTYYDTIVGVEPKKQALAAANERLAAASAKLDIVNARVAELTTKLNKLRAEFDAASAEKQVAISTVEKGKMKLDLAQRLTTALASENVRWAENVVELKTSEKLLTGDVLLASAFLTYIGPFTKPYRDNLFHGWYKFLKASVKGDGGFPITDNLNPLVIVSSEAEQAGWRANSLPDDPVSTENGAIVSNSARWPLMIDPQLQGIQWIKDQEGDALSIGRLGQKDLRSRLIVCLQNGEPFLIENMGESIEATLMPVVARQTFSRGKKKLIKLGDDEIELHSNFKLYMHTKLSNPHYPPEIQAEATLVNFTVTEEGLEDQLLALVVRKERADLAEERAQLVQQNNEFQIKLVELEDSILKKLADAEGDITEDVELIEGLEETKRVSTDIATKIEIAKKTQTDIAKTSEKYRPVASRGSLLFFVMNSIFKLHSFYMFSLNAFVVIFLHGIDLVTEKKEVNPPPAKKTGGFGGLMAGLGSKKGGKLSLMDRFRKAARRAILVERMSWNSDMLGKASRPSSQGKKIQRLPDLSDDELSKRCRVLEDSISKVVFNYLRRGLFDRDKLTVATQLCLKILGKTGQLSSTTIETLIIGPLSTNPGANGVLAEWMPNNVWSRVKGLEHLEQFRGLGDNMISDCDDWKIWFDAEKPEESPMPGDYVTLDAFSKILILRAMRPDRVTSELQAFIGNNLGASFINQPAFNMEKTFNETSPATPVFFVLFPGVDPTKLVEDLGIKKGFTEANGKFSNISMGQGQEANAEATMKKFSQNGGWVFLQNIHLMPGWLKTLERTLEKCSADANVDFRCFISAEPPPMPHWKTIPESLLQSCIKVSNEAPSDVKSNLRRAWATFSQDRISSCNKEVEFKACLFTICFFHSLILGRRKFGQQGWSRKYSFNVGDLSVCANVCQSYLGASNEIPWDDMRYIFGEIMYGGHITDPWDRRTNNTYLQVLLKDSIFNGEEMVPCRKGQKDAEGNLLPGLFFSPNPTENDFSGYTKCIEENLPKEAPVLFGLHPNAEIGYLSNTTSMLFASIIALRGGGGRH